MASICKHIVTKARTDDVWSAIRDVGALHTRLVPGFVTDTRLERGARIVTFGNGMVLREPIIAVDDKARRTRLVCRGCTLHTLQRVTSGLRRGRRRLARGMDCDFLPDEIASNQHAAMDAALQVMKATLDRFAEDQ